MITDRNLSRYSRTYLMAALVCLAIVSIIFCDMHFKKKHATLRENYYSSLVHKVLIYTQKNQLSNIVQLVSVKGVDIVFSEKDYTKMGKPLPKPSNHTKYSYLYQGARLPEVWTSYQVHFSMDELKSKACLESLKHIRMIILKTIQNYPSSITSSEDVINSPRFLGPSITGKVMSGAFWRFYLTKENGAWKIWRIEYIIYV